MFLCFLLILAVPKIKVLSDTLASQVAAGEVVERPSSVVKELVENSLDAGAKTIEVELQRGGATFIRVRDDGSGMSREDALLSLERHATSKLWDAEGLMAIHTFGFRGEALPSVASVAKLQLITRDREAEFASEILVEGGELKDVKDCGSAIGTDIRVSDLFFNIPARRKFLKTENTESAHVDHQLRLHALAHPQVRWVFRKEGRVVFDIAGVPDRRVRIGQLSGQDILKDLIEVPLMERHDFRVSGFLLPARHAKKGRRQQYLFLNGRPIEDQVVVGAIREAYTGAIPEGAHPMVWLWMEIDPVLVDVNVHPAKREVRFHRPFEVRETIIEAIQEALRAPQHVPSVIQSPQAREIQEKERSAEKKGKASFLQTILEEDGSALEAQIAEGSTSLSTRSLPERRHLRHRSYQTDLSHLPKLERGSDQPNFEILGTLHRRYIVIEGEDGLVLFEPKAGRERVIYEHLLKNTGQVSTQGLLVPVIVELEARDFAFFESNQDHFTNAGVGVESFGGTSVQIMSVPSFLKELDVAKLFDDFLGDLIASEGGKKARKIVYDHFAKSLAKQRARYEEVNLPQVRGLLKDLFLCDLPYCAPDGRPTMIQFSLQELDRKFHR